MSPQSGTRAMISIAGGLLAFCLSCGDDTPLSPRPDEVTAPTVGRTVATLNCSVDVATSHAQCVRESSPIGNRQGVSRAIFSTPIVVDISIRNASYTAADSTYSAEVRIVNRSPDQIGTRDGTSITGIKAFFDRLPAAYLYRLPDPAPPTQTHSGTATDTASVHVRNADGYADLTGYHQPYFFYDQSIGSDGSSAWKIWKFTVRPDVQAFAFRIKVFAAIPNEPEVPATIPRNSHTPSRYFADSVLVDCRFSGVGRCVPDVVAVRFRAGSTQEQRQAAIDAVGVYEGGMLDQYYVRFGRDTTLATLKATIAYLQTLPQVESVTPWGPSPISLDYRRPQDGGTWATWEVRDSAANGDNWALEAINAPLAWGCDTGTVHGTVGVVDSDFSLTLTDLSLVPGNAITGTLLQPADNLDHGTSTSSVIAATGNNGTGMTGLLWRSQIRAFEMAVTDSLGVVLRRPSGRPFISVEELIRTVEDAADSGATVINVSAGIEWRPWAAGQGYPDSATYNPGTQTNPTRRADRDSLIASTSRLFDAAMARIAARGHNVLIVLSAGNEGFAATWNPFTRVGAAARRHTMLVGAATRSGTGIVRSSFSSYGDSVDIFAPGEDVGTLIDNGSVQTRSGTSFAAPLVTGTAGLMMSLDPRLINRGDSIKILLLDGARRADRRVQKAPSSPDSLPFLDAYQALQRTARRDGTRLCGNRVWGRNGQLFAQFDTTSGAGIALFTSRERIGGVDVAHGGSRIDYQMVSDTPLQLNVQYPWQPPAHALVGDDIQLAAIGMVPGSHTWQSVALSPSAGIPGSGTARSATGASHGGDTLTSALITSAWTGAPYSDSTKEHITLFRDTGTGTDTLRVHTYPLAPQYRRPQNCAQGGTPCYYTPWSYYPPPSFSGFTRTAYSPQGEYVLVAVSRYAATVDTGSVPDAPVAWAGTFSADTIYYKPLGTDIYRVRLPNLTNPTLVLTIPDSAVFWISISEDGRQVVMATGQDSIKQPTRQAQLSPYPERTVVNCTVQYRSRSLATVLHSVASLGACPDAARDRAGVGGGSMAPLRANASSSLREVLNRAARARRTSHGRTVVGGAE